MSDAVAQKSPCEEMRVLMGKESPLTLSQRGPDAREEVPMRTPKRLSVHEMRLGLKWHGQTFSGCRGSSVYGRNLVQNQATFLGMTRCASRSQP